jgi:glycosyltransferase involved in cell wall biosynthesis
MTAEGPRLSIIFPAYNEGEAVADALGAALRYADEQSLEVEVLLVNDGSRDGTLEVARRVASTEPRVRVLSHTPNRGKGYAVKHGMLAATGGYRLFLDVDLATPVEEITQALAALDAGADIVLGSRHLSASQVEVKQRWLRRLMGSAFRWLARWMLRTPVSDYTCGFKAFRAEAARRLFGALTEPGWAFDAELIVLARKTSLRVVEVPVKWRDVRHSAVAPFSAALESLAALRRIRANERRGLYDDA